MFSIVRDVGNRLRDVLNSFNEQVVGPVTNTTQLGYKHLSHPQQDNQIFI